MAIYGIGAMYGRIHDKKDEFIQSNCACIGYDPDEAPALHRMLNKLKIGDFIYIKSMAGQSEKSLVIKAIGIVIDDRIEDRNGLGLGVTMKWIWQGEERILLTDQMYKNNVFNNTLYEEYNQDILTLILRKVFELLP
ncbi:hypothetical protein [Paenibacillus flagellatus]|uniref:Uncharacterized protein n=1 Tax=Paenibacillus flagellatus TaxID=2211139 RepID=A0A2V5KD99_9BACL|nr:hypothetical protein [Paenibacillus flagellatus]PYI56114.1 hypothetical protein DLM86_03725 [Paenibacillus flagellatus]